MAIHHVTQNHVTVYVYLLLVVYSERKTEKIKDFFSKVVKLETQVLSFFSEKIPNIRCVNSAQ